LVAWHQGNLFRLMVVGKNLSGGQSSGDVEHFLRSFKFLTSNLGSNTLLFQ